MFVVDLSRQEFVRVSGADAETFLQGQVSCDMNQLGDSNSLRGALCNLKGRVIADFRVLRQGEDCLLQTAPGMARKIIDTIAKYAVFSKATLQQDQNFQAVLGLAGDGISDALLTLFPTLPQQPDEVVSSEAGLLVRLAGARPRFELWSDSRALVEQLLDQPGMETAELADWQQEDFLAGILHVEGEHSEAYTPQLLNYDISGVINFKKGCYTGQEVVARMYYRAAAKKRLYLLRSTEPLEAGARINQYWQGRDQEAELLAFANGGSQSPQRHLALALLSVEGVEQGSRLELAETEAQLELVALPYMEQARSA